MTSSERSHGFSRGKYQFLHFGRGSATSLALCLLLSTVVVLIAGPLDEASADTPADPVATITNLRLETKVGVVVTAIDSSANTLDVEELADVWGSALPTSFDIYVDDERMTVSARSCTGSTCAYTVTRAVGSTTPAGHSVGATVTRVWTTTPYIVESNKAFGLKVSATVGVSTTDGDEHTATGWSDATGEAFDAGSCPIGTNPEVRTWTVTDTRYSNPKVKVGLTSSDLSTSSPESAPYSFSAKATNLAEGANTVEVLAKAQADKTITVYKVKEYVYRNGGGPGNDCYPATGSLGSAWSEVPTSYLTGVNANEVERVTLSNFDAGSSQNEIQKIVLSGLDPGVKEQQRMTLSNFNTNNDTFQLKWGSTTNSAVFKKGGSVTSPQVAYTEANLKTAIDALLVANSISATVTISNRSDSGFTITYSSFVEIPEELTVVNGTSLPTSPTVDQPVSGSLAESQSHSAAESFSLTYGGETRSFTHSSNASISAIDAFLEEKFTSDGTDDDFVVTENSANAAIDGSETDADFRIEFTGLLNGQPVSDSAIVVACAGCTSSSITTVQNGQSGVTDSFTLTYKDGGSQVFTHGSSASASAIDTWLELNETTVYPDNGDDFDVSGTTDAGPFLIRYDGFPGLNISSTQVARTACSGCTALVETVRDGAIFAGPTTTQNVVQTAESGPSAPADTTRLAASLQVTVDLIAPTLNQFNQFKGDRYIAPQGGTAQLTLGSNEGPPGSTGLIRLDAYSLNSPETTSETEPDPAFSFILPEVTFASSGQFNFKVEPLFPIPCSALVGEYLVTSTFYETKDAIGNTFALGSTADVGVLKVTPGDDLSTTTGFWGVNGDGTYSELDTGFTATKNKGNKRISTSPGVLHATTLLDATGRCTDDMPVLDFDRLTNEVQRVDLSAFQQGGGQNPTQPQLKLAVVIDGPTPLIVEGGTVTRGSTYTEQGLEAAIAEIQIDGNPLTVDVENVADNGFDVVYTEDFGETDIEFVLWALRVGDPGKDATASEVIQGGRETFDMTLEAPAGFRFEKTGQYFTKVIGGEWLPEEEFSYTNTSLWGGTDVTSQLVAENGPTGGFAAGRDVYNPSYHRYDSSSGFESIAPPQSAEVEIDLVDFDENSSFLIEINNVATAPIDGEATAETIELAIEAVRPSSNVRVSVVGSIPYRVISIDFNDGNDLVTSYYEGTDLEVAALVTEGSVGSATAETVARGHGELLRIRLDGLGSEVPADWAIFARARVRYNGEASTSYALPVECQSFSVRSSSHVDDYGASEPAASLTDISSYNFRYAPGSPVIGTSALPPAYVGMPYSEMLTGSNGLAWDVLDPGNLPAGLSVAADGTVSGTPGPGGLGLNVFQASLDGQCGSTFKSVALTVIDLRVESGPVLTNGVEGIVYEYQLTAAGGDDPYAWEVVDGDLPGGLLLDDGKIQGMPNAAGTYTFKVMVTDSRMATATKTLTITIDPPPPTP